MQPACFFLYDFCETVEPRIYVSASKRSSPHTYEDAYSGTPRGGNSQISRKGTKRMKRLICSQADKKEHRPPDQRWSAPDGGGALSWMELAELGSTQSTQSVFLPPMTGRPPTRAIRNRKLRKQNSVLHMGICGGLSIWAIARTTRLTEHRPSTTVRSWGSSTRAAPLREILVWSWGVWEKA